MRQVIVTLSLGLSSAACLGPLVDDTAGYSAHVLPPDAHVPSITDDPGLRVQIDRNDNVTADEGRLTRKPAWAAGEAVYYWDFGPAPRFSNPSWQLVRCDDGGEALQGPAGIVDHPRVTDAIPGDVQYSPFCATHLVCVTEAYGGERLPSVRALSDAMVLGLVREPVALGRWFNCPAVLPDLELETGGPARRPAIVYYRGREAYRFDFQPEGPRALARGNVIPQGIVYFLSKRGDAEYAETIFASARMAGGMPVEGYTPLVRVVRVTMSATYEPGTVRDARDLVSGNVERLVPRHDDVVDVLVTDELRNIEIQPEGP